MLWSVPKLLGQVFKKHRGPVKMPPRHFKWQFISTPGSELHNRLAKGGGQCRPCQNDSMHWKLTFMYRVGGSYPLPRTSTDKRLMTSGSLSTASRCKSPSACESLSPGPESRLT